MKVCTDACLFGAYMANEIKDSNSILDIGTGTGLLSLLLAQKSNAQIDTVEIDAAAFEQAKENIALSPWKESIHIVNTDINDFYPQKKYDYIISNPPFFEADLKSADDKKNAAKHDSNLTLASLLNNISRLLSDNGFFAVLIPFHRTDYFETAVASMQFSLVKKIVVQQTPKHNPFRAILIFSRLPATAEKQFIIIKNEEGNYSETFSELLREYYLYL
jgi:tRNA1Val (adenine37-N6)-methyltransferase